MDSQNRRICKKCLLIEANEEEYMEKLHKYIINLDKDVKADDILYQKRLTICKDCDRLESGTCQACGCYVELRAAVRKNRCPYKYW